MNEREIKQKVSEGYIHFRSIIQVLGQPENYVKDTIAGYLKRIEQDKQFIVAGKDVEKPTESEGMFTVFAELEILAKDFKRVIGFCFDYMPASVEVLAPDRIVYDSNDFTDYLNDMQARLHAVNLGAQDFKQHNLTLVRNTAQILKNFIVYSVREPKTREQLEGIAGVRGEALQKVLAALVSEKRIVKKGVNYSTK